MKISTLFEDLQLLNEANVFNVKIEYNNVSMAKYLAQYEEGLSTPEGKSIFKKKIAKMLMNDPRYHYSINQLPDNAPDWAKQAVEKRELVAFVPNEQLNDMLSHTMHYVADLEQGIVAGTREEKKQDNRNAAIIDNGKVALKELQGLPKIGDLNTLQKKSLEWFKRGSKKASKETYIDTKEIYDAGDGFKWYLLTSQKSYAREGKILQNCIGSHWTYSKTTDQGQSIVVMKRGNGETVVAARIENSTSEIHEMKGKNNKPPVEKYMPPVLKFINDRKLKVSNYYDFNNAGYFEIDGEWVKGVDWVRDNMEKRELGYYDSISMKQLVVNTEQEQEIIKKTVFNHLGYYYSRGRVRDYIIFENTETKQIVAKCVFDDGRLDKFKLEDNTELDELNAIANIITNHTDFDMGILSSDMFWSRGFEFRDGEWKNVEGDKKGGDWTIFTDPQGSVFNALMSTPFVQPLFDSSQVDEVAITKLDGMNSSIVAAIIVDGVANMFRSYHTYSYNLARLTDSEHGSDNDLAAVQNNAPDAIKQLLKHTTATKIDKITRFGLGRSYSTKEDGSVDEFSPAELLKSATTVSSDPEAQKIDLAGLDNKQVLITLWTLNKRMVGERADLFLFRRLLPLLRTGKTNTSRYPGETHQDYTLKSLFRGEEISGKWDDDDANVNRKITDVSSDKIMTSLYKHVPDAVYKVAVYYGHGQQHKHDVYMLAHKDKVVLVDTATAYSTWQRWDDYEQVAEQINKFLKANNLKIAPNAIPLGRELSRDKTTGMLTTGTKKSTASVEQEDNTLDVYRVPLNNDFEIYKLSNDLQVDWLRKVLKRVKSPGQGWMVIKNLPGGHSETHGLIFTKDNKITAAYSPDVPGSRSVTIVDLKNQQANPVLRKLFDMLEKEFGWIVADKAKKSALGSDTISNTSTLGKQLLDIRDDLRNAETSRFTRSIKTPVRVKRDNRRVLRQLSQLGLIKPTVHLRDGETRDRRAMFSFTPASEEDYRIQNPFSDNEIVVRQSDNEPLRLDLNWNWQRRAVGDNREAAIGVTLTPLGRTVADSLRRREYTPEDLANLVDDFELEDGWVKPEKKDPTPPKIVKKPKPEQGERTAPRRVPRQTDGTSKADLALDKFREMTDENDRIPTRGEFIEVMMADPFNMSKAGAQTYYYNTKKKYAALDEKYSALAGEQLKEELKSFKSFLIFG